MQTVQIRYPEYVTYNHKLYVMLKEAYGSRVRILANVIPISVRAAEISAEGVSIYKHDPKGKVALNRLSMRRWQNFIHSKTTLSGWRTMRRWRKQRRVSGSTGCLCWGLQDRGRAGGYEIIAGHRRKRGSGLARKTEMPVAVSNYTNDEATIIMVDSNIQREYILPSEKARAYKMKYEAMKHQGKKSGTNTLDAVGEAAGENAKKVQRYIWISRLSDELLALVDGKKLGFSQGVDISFLAEEAQQWVQAVIEEKGCNVSMVQSAKNKEYGKTGHEAFCQVLF